LNYHIYLNETNISANHNAAINEYIKRLSAFCNSTVHTGKELSIPKDICKQGHGVLIIRKGQSTLSSTDFADYIAANQLSGISTLHVLLGFSDSMLNDTLHLSDFSTDKYNQHTPQHSPGNNINSLFISSYELSPQTTTLLFVEQLYRAYTIISGKTYHK